MKPLTIALIAGAGVALLVVLRRNTAPAPDGGLLGELCATAGLSPAQCSQAQALGKAATGAATGVATSVGKQVGRLPIPSFGDTLIKCDVLPSRQGALAAFPAETRERLFKAACGTTRVRRDQREVE